MQEPQKNLPFITDGVFNGYYDDTTSAEAVESYYEVDLGELNLINIRTNFFKRSGEEALRSRGSIEHKTWKYQNKKGLKEPVLDIICRIGIKGYDTIDSAMNHHNILFPLLLERGYYLYGTRPVNLYKSIIPSIEYRDFDFFFFAKLFYVARNLKLIDPFLEYQLKNFTDAGKSAMDFKVFLKRCMLEFSKGFSLREEAIVTVEEWLRGIDKNQDKQEKDVVKYKGWTKSMAILARSFRNVKQSTFVISDQTRTAEAFAVLSGYSPRSISDQAGALEKSRDFTDGDFSQAKNFLKNAIRELEKLEENVNQKK